MVSPQARRKAVTHLMQSHRTPLFVTVDPTPETLTLSPALERVNPLLMVMTQFAAATSLSAVELLLESVTGHAVANTWDA